MAGVLDELVLRNGVRVKNRAFVAPLTNLQSNADGTLSAVEKRWLEMRAEGGFGLVTTCAAHVNLGGQGWPGELGVFDDRLLPGLTELASCISMHSSLGVVQIFHGGARAPSSVTGQRPVSSSEFSDDAPGFEVPRALAEREVELVVGDFVAAALRAQKAGFAGVEVHGAHGYLLSQFLSRTMNTRADRWGGASFENRARLLRTVVRGIRAAVSPGFVLAVRISPEDFGQAKGLDLDESLELARWLCDDGVDYLHLSLWRSFLNSTKRPDAHPIPLFRSVCPADVPLVVAGAIWSGDDAQRLLDMGASAVALGRAAICNPDWPRRIAEGAAIKRPPSTPAELIERGVSEGFVGYLRRWKGFVEG